MKNTSKFQNVVIVTIVGWLVLFVFLPNLMIIGTSFLTRDDASFVKMVFTLDNYTRLLDPLYFEVLLHSLNMALIATLACLVLGYPFAWFLAKLPHKVRPLLLFLLIVPFWTNSLIRIYGLKIFLSTKGYLNEFLLWLGVIDTPIRIMFTPSAVIIGLVYILLPFMVMPLYSSIEKLDKPLLEAARDLGASKLQTFIRIIIPLTMPGIIAGCLLVMLPAMGLFYVSDLMGGAKNLLIGNVIKVQFLNIRDWPFGAATSITLTIVMGLMLLVYWRASRNSSRFGINWQGFTTKWYSLLMNNDSLLQAAQHSLTMAVFSATFATLIGSLTAVALYRYRFRGKPFVSGMLFVVMMSPDIVMAISLLVLFMLLGIQLGFWSLLFSHITFCLPFVVVTVYSRLKGFDVRMLEAAKDLGASEFTILRKIILPLAMPAVAAGWVLSFTLSMDDVVVSSFVTGPSYEILPLKIYSMVKVGVSPEVNALATILLVLSLVMVIASQLIARDKTKGNTGDVK
ncbi:MAG: spermidine/putrescine ABC transporter permease PotB [Escherichia coli]|nr:spermidine/putrescine ABC transporter permease PotB [Escherichia coli]